MSTPALPAGLDNTRVTRVANQLHSATIHLLRRARREDPATGLGPSQLSLLSVLVFGGARTPGALAEAEQVSRPAITKLVQGLARLKLVKRQADPADGRRVVVETTAKGRRLIEMARRRRIERIAADLARLDADELAVVDAATRILATRRN